MLILSSVIHALLLLAVPTAPVIALGLWWNANTISHNFIHRPFFHGRAHNRLYSLYLTLLLGVPQTLWRDRHLAHHAGVAPRFRRSPELFGECVAVIALWAALIGFLPSFFFGVYFPGWIAGLCLCQIHGYFEHSRGTTSHYGAIYNFVFFNDGYHVEHHLKPGVAWNELPGRVEPNAPASAWPAVLRWIESLSVASLLGALERYVLSSPLLQRFVLSRHERAFRKILPALAGARRIAIVGGALFPRTALILGRCLPSAELIIIDGSRENVEAAKRLFGTKLDARFVEEWYDPRRHYGFDALVVPLALEGDRNFFYETPPAPVVLVHDWIWRRHNHGAVISSLFLKRLNVVTPETSQSVRRVSA